MQSLPNGDVLNDKIYVEMSSLTDTKITSLFLLDGLKTSLNPSCWKGNVAEFDRCDIKISLNLLKVHLNLLLAVLTFKWAKTSLTSLHFLVSFK